MTMKRFTIADHHLGQEKVLSFEHNGKPLRPFSTIEEMHECLIDNHNSVVRPVDKVYFCGDVAFRRAALSLLSRFNGRKVLVKGNHDVYKLKDYMPYFEDIRGIAVLPFKAILTHVPVHSFCLNRPSWPVNIHGHLHAHNIDDDRYINVSCEQVNYTPVEIESLLTTENN